MALRVYSVRSDINLSRRIKGIIFSLWNIFTVIENTINENYFKSARENLVISYKISDKTLCVHTKFTEGSICQKNLCSV